MDSYEQYSIYVCVNPTLDLTPTSGKERRCKVGKASCVLWACLGTAAMLICVTGEFYTLYILVVVVLSDLILLSLL